MKKKGGKIMDETTKDLLKNASSILLKFGFIQRELIGQTVIFNDCDERITVGRIVNWTYNKENNCVILNINSPGRYIMLMGNSRRAILNKELPGGFIERDVKIYLL